jgi:ribosomal RNA-processing protein 17
VLDNGDTDEEVEDGEDAEDWEGIADPEPPPVDHEAEYVDEDKYTTVTVEAMDVTREGLFKADQEEQEDPTKDGGEMPDPAAAEPQPEKKKRIWSKDNPKDKTHKPKKKRNFRYESKAERKVTRTKQRSKSSKQARERREKG